MSVFNYYSVKLCYSYYLPSCCYCYSCLTDNAIDGEALLCLTERALEQLIPVIGHRMKFLKELENLQKNCPPGGNNVAETVQVDQVLERPGPSDKESDKQTSLRYTHVCHQHA